MHASTSRAVLSRPAPVRSLRAARATAPSSRSALKVVAKEFSGPYTAENKYKCLNAMAAENLSAEWRKRHAAMQSKQGFVSFDLKDIGNGDFEVAQTWDSKEAYEAWMDSDEKRKSHFFGGIYQYKTKDKYSVMEEFMPVLTQAGKK